MRKSAINLSILIIILSLIVVGCGGDGCVNIGLGGDGANIGVGGGCGVSDDTGSSAESRTITGTIANQGIAQKSIIHRMFDWIVPDLIADNEHPLEIWIVPILPGNDSVVHPGDVLSKSYVVNVEGNGNFTAYLEDIDFGSAEDYVLLLIDKNKQNRKDQIVATLATKIDESTMLFLLPVKGMKGLLRLGVINVDYDNKFGVSERTLEENFDSFDEATYLRLQETSRYDNYIKLVINDYINNYGRENYYSTGFSIQLVASFSDLFGNGSIDNVTVNHNELHLYSNDSITKFRFVSPSGVYSDAGNQGEVSAVKWFYALPAEQPIESGFWQIEGDNEVVAEFYYALDIAFDADGNPLVPIPVITPTYDGDNKITEMSIEWKIRGLNDVSVVSSAVLDKLIERKTFWIQSTDTDTQMFDRGDMEGDFNNIIFNQPFDATGRIQIGFRFGSYKIEYAIEQDPT